MNLLVDSLPYVLGGLVLLGILILLRKPLRWLYKLAARTLLGLGALALFSQAGGIIGVSLGVNLINAFALGLLGAPGFALLLMLKWTFLH